VLGVLMLGLIAAVVSVGVWLLIRLARGGCGSYGED
jgi:hypothetical protein